MEQQHLSLNSTVRVPGRRRAWRRGAAASCPDPRSTIGRLRCHSRSSRALQTASAALLGPNPLASAHSPCGTGSSGLPAGPRARQGWPQGHRRREKSSEPFACGLPTPRYPSPDRRCHGPERARPYSRPPRASHRGLLRPRCDKPERARNVHEAHAGPGLGGGHCSRAGGGSPPVADAQRCEHQCSSKQSVACQLRKRLRAVS